MKVLFATTNKARVKYYALRLKEKGIDLVTLDDLDISAMPKENGNNPLGNAIIKAKEYARLSGLLTISIDDGLFLDGIPIEEQPGTHVRRVNGKRLNDEEMIEYYTGLVNKYGSAGELKGHILKGIAVVFGDNLESYQKKLPRCYTNKQSKIIDAGYPLSSIQMISKFNKFKSELTREEESITIDLEQKEIFDFMMNAIEKLSF